MVQNPKTHLLSCDLSVRQFKRCYFWEHSVCLSVFCIARMAEETSLSLHHGSHLWKACRLQSLISAHVTSPPAFSCTLHTRGKLCARLHVWANQFDNIKKKNTPMCTLWSPPSPEQRHILHTQDSPCSSWPWAWRRPPSGSTEKIVEVLFIQRPK